MKIRFVVIRCMYCCVLILSWLGLALAYKFGVLWSIAFVSLAGLSRRERLLQRVGVCEHTESLNYAISNIVDVSD